MKTYNIGSIILLLAISVFEMSYAADSKMSAAEKQNNYQKRIGNKFLAGVAEREGITKMKSGMLVEILKSSEDADPISPDVYSNCEVTYIGMFPDGKVFDQGTTKFMPRQVIQVQCRLSIITKLNNFIHLFKPLLVLCLFA